MNAKRVREPGNPSAKERAEHELNHWPYRSWCEACVKGRAVGQQHRSMKGEYAESPVARVLMDYGFLHAEQVTVESEHGQEVESKTSMTIMVILETLCSSVWGYAIEGKTGGIGGVGGTAGGRRHRDVGSSGGVNNN